jgi:hypothetical protein
MADNIEVILVSDYENYISNIHKDRKIEVGFRMTN